MQDLDGTLCSQFTGLSDVASLSDTAPNFFWKSDRILIRGLCLIPPSQAGDNFVIRIRRICQLGVKCYATLH